MLSRPSSQASGQRGALRLGLVAFVAMMLAVTGSVGAGSLWGGESLFTDRKARRPGDLVTLLIVERTEASQSASTRTGKGSSVQLGPWGGIASGWPGFGGSYSDDLQAGGDTRRGGALQARMTARVVEVFPNGNLLIEGRQSIVVNAEEQELIVSGVVRETDISPDNTVLSSYMADARISFRGSGSLGNKQNPGILSTILGWLF